MALPCMDRERLLNEIRGTELQGSVEREFIHRQIADMEAQAQHDQQAYLKEQLLCDAMEVKEQTTHSVESLAFDIQSVRGELVAAKSRLGIAAARRQQSFAFDELVTAIRTSEQENQALQANGHMAQAHLKALEAMAASSAAQVRVREGALCGAVRQLEEQECVVWALQQRSEAAEVKVAEIREPTGLPTSVRPAGHAMELQQLEVERDRLRYEARCLEHDLYTGRCREETVEEFEAMSRALRDSASLQTHAEQWTEQLSEENRVVANLQHRHSNLELVSSEIHAEAQHDIANLEAELSAALADGAADQASLTSQLKSHESKCSELQAEALQYERHFRSMSTNLRELLTSLRKEEQEEMLAQAQQHQAVSDTTSGPRFTTSLQLPQLRGGVAGSRPDLHEQHSTPCVTPTLRLRELREPVLNVENRHALTETGTSSKALCRSSSAPRTLPQTRREGEGFLPVTRTTEGVNAPSDIERRCCWLFNECGLGVVERQALFERCKTLHDGEDLFRLVSAIFRAARADAMTWAQFRSYATAAQIFVPPDTRQPLGPPPSTFGGGRASARTVHTAVGELPKQAEGERRAAVQARLADLRSSIGASLRELGED